MKKRNIIISLALAAVMLFTGVVVVGATDSIELPTQLTPVSIPANTIYYFSDYYPTLEKDVMEARFGVMNIVYSNIWIDEDDFPTIAGTAEGQTQPYFISAGANSTVIIDIKTFQPDDNDLLSLFSRLKQDLGCKTVFVTPYNEADFYDTSFLEYVDVHFVTEFQRLTSFINNMFDLVIEWQLESPPSNMTMLIDGRLIDIIYDEDGNYDIEAMCAESPFLRILLDRLKTYVDLDEVDTYQLIANTLFDSTYNLNLLLNTSPGVFVNLSTNQTYYISSAEDLQINYNLSWEYICGFGFWEFEIDYYSLLSFMQVELNGMDIFALEVDEVGNQDDILLITDRYLETIGDAHSSERMLLLLELLDLLEELLGGDE